jgi:Family of unknown function (DUF6843)
MTLTACFEFRTPEVVKFPEGFRGYAVIVWNIPSYAPLSERDGKLIEEFPADGIIITSTLPQYGIARDEFYFVVAGGRLVPTKDVSLSVGEVKRGSKKMQYTTPPSLKPSPKASTASLTLSLTVNFITSSVLPSHLRRDPIRFEPSCRNFFVAALNRTNFPPVFTQARVHCLGSLVPIFLNIAW